MASSDPDFELTGLQRRVLERFDESGFYLTGGAALIGYHLHHRHTDDLDLFTQDPEAFERGPFVLKEVARELGAVLQTRQHAPGFQRHVLSSTDDAVVVDLVIDDVPQVSQQKEQHGGVRVDPLSEILANKLGAVLSRAEVRDLVDVMAIEEAGYPVEDALPGAMAKDGGCTPATLAWVLSQVSIPKGATLPGAVTPAELSDWLADLIVRLRKLAAPGCD